MKRKEFSKDEADEEGNPTGGERALSDAGDDNHRSSPDQPADSLTEPWPAGGRPTRPWRLRARLPAMFNNLRPLTIKAIAGSGASRSSHAAPEFRELDSLVVPGRR